ncbi:uncharacterized protein V6R79_013751 [Siganus canaliculatus]
MHKTKGSHHPSLRLMYCHLCVLVWLSGDVLINVMSVPLAHAEVVCCLTCCHGRFRFPDGELFIPEVLDLHEAQAADHGDARQAAGGSSSSISSGGGDKWLLAEVFDIISADWQTWFGTLCVLLWLLYLIIL